MDFLENVLYAIGAIEGVYEMLTKKKEEPEEVDEFEEFLKRHNLKY